jgi:hypothetical protein
VGGVVEKIYNQTLRAGIELTLSHINVDTNINEQYLYDVTEFTKKIYVSVSTITKSLKETNLSKETKSYTETST